VYQEIKEHGSQKYLTNTGKWYAASITKKQVEELLKTDANFRHDWNEEYGDRMVKLVFIGQNLDKSAIKKELDEI